MALITPKKVTFSSDVMDRLWNYVDKQLDAISMEGETFRETTLPEWTRLLKGIPKEQTKNFPFPNASNLVVQLIATRVEQMLSRAMIMWGIDPLWEISATGDLVGREADEEAKMLEQFMGDQAIDPEELNLYRKEEIMIHNGIAYGTAHMAFPWQYITEAVSTTLPGEVSGKLTRADEFKTFIKKDGPSPENVPLSDMFISNKVTDLEKARFVGKRIRLSREAIEDRIAFGVWSKADGDAILKSPDTVGSTYTKTMMDANKQIQTSGNEYDAQYFVYECYFKFVHDRTTFSIVAHYHRETKTRLSAVFNYFPNNALPIEDIRFGYDDESYLGYGFIEMLKGYQSEVSTLHNNRLDNEAIRNNVAFRINKDSELASTVKFYPGVVIPADEGEIDILDTKAGAMDNMASESGSISMTNERAGIDPAISGNGGGIVNNKRGVYSSQGTMAVLQQQNNRTGLRMMDIRMTHAKIGRKLLDMYAFMGVGKKLARYGEQAPILRKALDSVKEGSIGLVLKATSASSNADLDRQNSILLQGLQEKYMMTVNQMLGAINQPQTSPEQKAYMIDMLFAEQALTRHIFRLFGKHDVDKLVPFPESIKNERFKQQQASSQPSAGNQKQISGPVPSGSTSNNGPVPSGTEG